MKEYLRIIFGEWDVMNNKDWELWNKYSKRTFIVLISLVVIVHVVVILIR
jgi:hypothetical protein